VFVSSLILIFYQNSNVFIIIHIAFLPLISGELFLRFLDYYSNFDYVRKAISVRTGGTLLIEQCKNVRAPKNDSNHWKTLCIGNYMINKIIFLIIKSFNTIEEPFDYTNTARSTYDWDIFSKIKNAFFQSWRRLNDAKDLNYIFQDPLFVKQVPQHSMVFIKFYFF
jgi:poly(A) RNA polymerase GLD2